MTSIHVILQQWTYAEFLSLFLASFVWDKAGIASTMTYVHETIDVVCIDYWLILISFSSSSFLGSYSLSHASFRATHHEYLAVLSFEYCVAGWNFLFTRRGQCFHPFRQVVRLHCRCSSCCFCYYGFCLLFFVYCYCYCFCVVCICITDDIMKNKSTTIHVACIR